MRMGLNLGGVRVSEFEYRYNQNPKCPHCGYELKDIWDYDFNLRQDEEEELDCPGCEEEYKFVTHIEMTFSTKNFKGEVF